MQLSKKVYAFGEREADKYTRAELKELLKILDESGIDISKFFLTEEHLLMFQNYPDKEKLRQIKQIIISNYDKEIRTQIALKLAEKIETQTSTKNFLLNSVLSELDRLLNSICFCLFGNIAYEDSIFEDTNDYNFFEKILYLFRGEHSEELEALKKYELKSFDVEPQKKKPKKQKVKSDDFELG